MEQLTGLCRTIISSAPDKFKLDQTVKSLLAHKSFLALQFSPRG